VAACEPGYADCNTAAADGCEVDATSDTGNCGGCGLVCNLPHAVQSCQGGACKVGQCTAGWGNCDGYHANGCEAFLLSDPSHCGACNNVCSFAHASSLCLSGSCSMGACSAGWADCDGSSSTGCEAQLATDLNHCGACNAACAPPHATGACTAGSCKLGACAPGYSDCNGVLADGCEVATASDPEHCGGCGLACNLPHAAAMCQSGACKVQACQPGYGDCDAVATNGCEATLASDPSHCGACQSACALPHAASLCSAGSCQVASCQAGWANCDGLAANGCEISTASNPAHCGACGHSCQGGSCLNGACQPVALVTGQQNPWSIAVDGQFVYWDNRVASGAVLKVPLTGGGFLTLAAEQPEPEGLALDAQYVYWANFAGGTIMRLALAGGVPTVVASGQSGPAGITAWGGTVFWTNWNGNSVMRVVPGNAPSPLATGQSSPHRIATDGSSVWWTNWAGNTVRRVDALGGTAVTVASSGQPLGVTLDSGWVYWTDASSILRAPIEGGPVTTLATGQDHPSGIVVDADNVYFTCHAPGGSVRRVLKTGGPVITLAAAQNLPVYLATDATSLYWTNSGSGTVMKLAK
jgi:sugar lactone lactonase YvrE